MDVDTFFNELEKLFKQNKKDEAFRLVKRFSKGKKDVIAEMLFDEGNYYGNEEDDQKALFYFELSGKMAKNKELKKLISQNTAITHYNLGNLLSDLKRYEEAEKEYREAIRINPEYAETHYNLGILLSDLKRYEEAEKEFKEAIRINPEYADAHNNLGILLSDLKRYEEAEKEFKEAIRINPEYAEAHNNFGVLLKELKRHKEAENEYKKAIEINPNNAEAHANYGFLLFLELNSYNKARFEFETATKIFLERGMDYDSKKMEGHQIWSEAIILLKKNPEKSMETYLESSKIFEEIGDNDLAEYLSTCSTFISLDLRFKNVLSLDPSQIKEKINKLMKDVEKITFNSKNPDTEIFSAKISCFQILNEIFQKTYEIEPRKKLNLDHLRKKLEHPKEIFKKWNLYKEVEHLKSFERIIAFVENYGLKFEDKLMGDIRKLVIYDGATTSSSQITVAGKYSEPYTSKSIMEAISKLSGDIGDLKREVIISGEKATKEHEKILTEIQTSKTELISILQTQHKELLDKVENLNESQSEELKKLIYEQIEEEIVRGKDPTKKTYWNKIKKTIPPIVKTVEFVAAIIQIYTFIKTGQTENIDQGVNMVKDCLLKIL